MPSVSGQGHVGVGEIGVKTTPISNSVMPCEHH